MNARHVLVVLFAGMALSSAVRSQGNDQDKFERVLELKRLQGAWTAKLLVTDAGVEPYPLQGRGLVFDKEHFVRMEGRRIVQTGKIRIDPESHGLEFVVDSNTPWDVENQGAPMKTPFSLRCSYRVVDDLLTVCYSTGKDRPSDLKPGDGRTVVVYERGKDAGTKPAGPMIVKPRTEGSSGQKPPAANPPPKSGLSISEKR